MNRCRTAALSAENRHRRRRRRQWCGRPLPASTPTEYRRRSCGSWPRSAARRSAPAGSPGPCSSTARQRRCLSHEGSRNTRPRRCLSHGGSTARQRRTTQRHTTKRHCRTCSSARRVNHAAAAASLPDGPQSRGAVLAAEVVEHTRQRHCPSRESCENARHRHCLSREGSGTTLGSVRTAVGSRLRQHDVHPERPAHRAARVGAVRTTAAPPHAKSLFGDCFATNACAQLGGDGDNHTELDATLTLKTPAVPQDGHSQSSKGQ